MKKELDIFLGLVLVAGLASAQGQTLRNGSTVTVDVTQGRFVGLHVDYGSNRQEIYYGQADVFLGIPFAQPPIGSLRFQRPQPVRQTNETINVTTFKPACPQQEFVFGQSSTNSEDCLYLNVLTPSARTNTQLPVMVWIHGGALKSGSASEYGVQGIVRNLVSRGVVVVTIQYRLGLLGFFTNDTPDFPANNGILDQIEALRWVSGNIASFGGNPDDVTIFGQSAGGCSVSTLTYSPLAQGLFHKAILQSGTVWTCLEGYNSFTNNSFNYANKLCGQTWEQFNLRDSTALTRCLMNMDYSRFVDGTEFKWAVKVDGFVLPDVPRNLVRQRRPIPVMLGTVSNEFAAMPLIQLSVGALKMQNFNRSNSEEQIGTQAPLYGNNLPEATRLLESAYLPAGTRDDDHIAWLKFDDAIGTAMGFTAPTGRDATFWASNGNQDVFLYEFTHSSNMSSDMLAFKVAGWSPVTHGAELAYVFPQPDPWVKMIRDGRATPVDYRLVDWFGETWTNFAKTGRPRQDPAEWQPLRTDHMNYLRIGDAQYQMLDNYRKTDLDVFNKRIPDIVGVMPPP